MVLPEHPRFAQFIKQHRVFQAARAITKPEIPCGVDTLQLMFGARGLPYMNPPARYESISLPGPVGLLHRGAVRISVTPGVAGRVASPGPFGFQ